MLDCKIHQNSISNDTKFGTLYLCLFYDYKGLKATIKFDVGKKYEYVFTEQIFVIKKRDNYFNAYIVEIRHKKMYNGKQAFAK